MDLSYPPQSSVNNGIPGPSYLNELYNLRLPDIDRLVSLSYKTDTVVYSAKRIYSVRSNSRFTQKITNCWVSSSITKSILTFAVLLA